MQRGKEEFLSRLGDVSDVTVTSRHRLDAACKSLHLRAGAAPRVADDTPRAPNTTAVRAARLFWNVPVRQQALRVASEWEAVRLTVMQAALAYEHITFQLHDLDSGRTVLSCSPSRGVRERFLELCKADSVIVASTGASFVSPVQALLYGGRGSAASGARAQLVLVNGVPVEADWISSSIARDLSWTPAGPIKMGSPRLTPVFLLQLTCPDAMVEFSSSASIWFAASFQDNDVVKRAVRQVVSQLSAAPPPPRSPAVASPTIAKLSPRILLAPASRLSPVVSPAVRKSSSSSPSPAQQTAAELLSSWSNPCLKFNDQLAVPAPAASAIEEVRLQKSDLQQVRIVGQVERKLILAVVSSRYVVAFDQHAVHERILLETLLAEVRGNTAPLMKDMSVNVAHLGEAVVRLERDLLPWFRVSEQVLTGCAVMLGEALTAQDLAEHLEDVSAGHRLIPKAVHRLLAFKACRSAIKFGDEVSQAHAVSLLARLADCDFPFVCAHGRQSLAVLHVL